MARPVRPVQETISPWPFVGMGLMATTLFLYAASGLVAPWWAVVLLLAAWAVCFRQATTWWSTHPKRITVLAVAMALAWFVILVAGGAFLGWS